MKKITIISLCLIGFALSECKSTKSAVATTPAPAPAAAPVAVEAPKPAAPDPIAVGQMVYQSKCYQCHDLPKPADYPKAEWADIMVKMSRKAHLSDAETEQVLAYVKANARQ